MDADTIINGAQAFTALVSIFIAVQAAMALPQLNRLRFSSHTLYYCIVLIFTVSVWNAYAALTSFILPNGDTWYIAVASRLSHMVVFYYIIKCTKYCGCAKIGGRMTCSFPN